MFAYACKMGLEGIVSKRKDPLYRSGRSPDWIKRKNPGAPAVRREAEEHFGVGDSRCGSLRTKRRSSATLNGRASYTCGKARPLCQTATAAFAGPVRASRGTD